MVVADLEVEGQKVFFQSSTNLANLDGLNAKLVITSPPYWNLKDYGHKDQIGQADYNSYLDDIEQVFRECFRLTSKNAVMVVNVGNRRAKKQFYPIAFDLAQRAGGWELWDMLIWYIPNALPQPNYYRERLFDNKYENVMVFTKGGDSGYTFHKPRVPQKYADKDPRKDKMNQRGRCLGNIFRIPAYRPPNIKEQHYHIAAYPDELAALMIASFTMERDIVLDPFLGSGTTLKVCRELNRCGVGVELNRDFATTIQNRIQSPMNDFNWQDLDLISNINRTRPRYVK